MKIEELRRKIAQRVGEAMGMASVCWIPKPTGIFDSTQASKAVDHVMKYTDALLDVAEIAKEFNKRKEAPCLTWDGWLALSDALKKLEEL